MRAALRCAALRCAALRCDAPGQVSWTGERRTGVQVRGRAGAGRYRGTGRQADRGTWLQGYRVAGVHGYRGTGHRSTGARGHGGAKQTDVQACGVSRLTVQAYSVQACDQPIERRMRLYPVLYIGIADGTPIPAAERRSF